jgi:hypothetical protein
MVVPEIPSLVAEICAVPVPIAVSSPNTETIPTALLLELQLITRPVRTLLFASRVWAESCNVPPTGRLEDAGDTDTVATGTGVGALTVIAAEAVMPSLAAVIVALPEAIAVTRPDAETVLMAGLPELQVTARPVSTLLFASRVVAESCTVAAI